MKSLKIMSAICFIAFIAVTSCKKDQYTVSTSPLAAINVTNAVVGGTSLKFNADPTSVGTNAYVQYLLNAGTSSVNLYPAATPGSPYYNQPLAANNGDYYSLFLAGASPATVDAILVKESYKNYTDSLAGVRFINLSPNSNAISVNISGNANGSEVTTLAYKAYTGFRAYPAKLANTSYVFQFRDAVTGNLITTVTLSLTGARFHNVTLALRGLISAPGVMTVNDY